MAIVIGPRQQAVIGEAFQGFGQNLGQALRGYAALQQAKEEREETKKIKEKQLSLEEERLKLAQQAQETALFTKAIALTEKRKKGIFGKKEIQPEDVLENLQLLKSLQNVTAIGDEEIDQIAAITPEDVKEFINNKKERDKLRKTNSVIYNTLLAEAHSQGDLQDIKLGETDEKVGLTLPDVKKPSVVPKTASPEERIGERIGQTATGLAQRVGLTPSNIIGGVSKLPSQALGVLGSGYNLLSGASQGLTGQRAVSIPPKILDVLRRGELFQNPVQNLATSGQFLQSQAQQLAPQVSQFTEQIIPKLPRLPSFLQELINNPRGQ